MADLIIQNPSITPNVFEYDEAGRVSAIDGYPLAGGGGGTIVKSDLMWKPNVGNDGYVHWTLASSATSPEAAYISGAQGPAGPQGVSGNPGKNPEFQINPTDAHWQWRYSGDAGWTDLGIVASGAVGPQGLSGDDGEDGISPKVRINNSTNFWEISEDNGVTWTSTNVSATGPAGKDGEDGTDGKDGASGTNGKDGISPTISTSAIPGGNRVIFTYDNGGTPATESIDVMSGASGANGSDGFSPTVTTSEIGPTSEHPQGGTSVTITDKTGPNQFNVWNGINGQGATVNLLEGPGIQIRENGTSYTISVSADYSGAATAWVNGQGYLTNSDLNNYATKSYVEDASANALSQAESWVENKHYLTSVPDTYALKSDVPTAVAQLTDSGNYYKKTETSGATEITNALSTKLDSTAAAQTYQTKSDMTNYLTTSDASTTYQPIGNYASASDIVGMATQTWVGQQGFITKDANDLTYYYKKTETSGASELSTEFAKKLEAPAANVGDFCIWQTTAQNPGWTDITDWWNTKSSEIVEYEYIPDTIIPQNGLSANWNTNKAELKFGLSAEYENAIKTISAKSRTTINSNQVVTTENNGTSATVSAVQYVTNDSFSTAPKQLFVCQDDNDLTAHLNICNGKGTLFFVCSAI